MTPRQFKKKEPSIKHNKVSFFIDENRKTPSISIEFRRPDSKVVAKWTPEQREIAYEWFKRATQQFEDFKDELNDLLLP